MPRAPACRREVEGSRKRADVAHARRWPSRGLGGPPRFAWEGPMTDPPGSPAGSHRCYGHDVSTSGALCPGDARRPAKYTVIIRRRCGKETLTAWGHFASAPLARKMMPTISRMPATMEAAGG
jgi:hypothetical protein